LTDLPVFAGDLSNIVPYMIGMYRVLLRSQLDASQYKKEWVALNAIAHGVGAIWFD
jgi:hypothetical protein